MASLAEERSEAPAASELVSGADDPLPSQRQDDPVRAGLSSYGRRRGSPSAPAKQKWRSYRAARRLSSEDDASPTHTGIRATTNQVRIGDPVTRTQIREQSESNFCAGPAHRPSGLPRRLGTVPFPPASRRTKHERIGQLPNRRSRARASQALSQRPIRRQVWLPKPCLRLRLPAPIRDAGEGTGHKRSRNRRRARRAIRRAKGNPHSAAPPRRVTSWRPMR